MNRKIRLFAIFGILVLGVVLAGLLPATERISDSKTALLRSNGTNRFPVQLNVLWWDLGLNKERFSTSVKFDDSGRAIVPKAEVPTRLWRIALKRVLSRFDKWSACEHCDGPWVDASLQLTGEFQTAEKTRLVQNRTEGETNIIFEISIVPDERKFEPREFHIRDHGTLLSEVKSLMTNGPTSQIPFSDFGPELRAINPVRAECKDSAVVLWMGGKVGYAIVPESDSCPAMNRVLISGTSHPHIFKLKKLD